MQRPVGDLEGGAEAPTSQISFGEDAIQLPHNQYQFPLEVERFNNDVSKTENGDHDANGVNDKQLGAAELTYQDGDKSGAMREPDENGGACAVKGRNSLLLEDFSEKTIQRIVHELETKGYVEEHRYVYLSGKFIHEDDLVRLPPDQYQEFLLEVERFNDEYYRKSMEESRQKKERRAHKWTPGGDRFNEVRRQTHRLPDFEMNKYAGVGYDVDSECQAIGQNYQEVDWASDYGNSDYQAAGQKYGGGDYASGYRNSGYTASALIFEQRDRAAGFAGVGFQGTGDIFAEGDCDTAYGNSGLRGAVGYGSGVAEVGRGCEVVAQKDGGDEDGNLDITELRPIAMGFIINGSVYITLAQWHTLIKDPEINQTYCSLCDTYIDLGTESRHIEEKDHLGFLNKFKPLKRFELSITRLIRTIYHCGVCNELFDDREDNFHLDSKEHGDYMLFAINKASDMMDHSGDGARPHHGGTLTYPAEQPHIHTRMSYSSCFTKPAPPAQGEGAPDRFYDQDDGYYEDVNDPLTPGISYAQMTRKKKAEEPPAFLKFTLRDKVISVKYDSWHMIVFTGLNRMYCMACQVTQHKRRQVEHCNSMEHTEQLRACPLVDLYSSHLVRKVGDRLYHCGHCNNLQLIEAMDDHLQFNHNFARPITTLAGCDEKNKPSTSQPPKVDKPGISPLQKVDKPGTSQEVPKNIEKPSTSQEVPIDLPNTTGVRRKPTNPLAYSNSATEKHSSSHSGTSVVTETSANTVGNSSPSIDNSLKPIGNGNHSIEPKSTQEVPSISKSHKAIKPPVSELKTPSAIPSPSIQHHSEPVLYPGVKFEYNFMKTIVQFGYKLSVHILALNAIVEVQNLFRCMLCDRQIEESLLLQHTTDLRHGLQASRAPFLPEFSLHLIRRIKMLVHCTICNIMLPDNYLIILSHNTSHGHGALLRRALGFIPPSMCSNQPIPGAYPSHRAAVPNVNAPMIPAPPRNLGKLIVVKDEVFMLKWENWHGVSPSRCGFRCGACAMDVRGDDWSGHLASASHRSNVGRPFVRDRLRDLLRKVSNSRLHCVICNLELTTSDNLQEHLSGKKHNTCRGLALEESAKPNAYQNCDDEVIFL